MYGNLKTDTLRLITPLVENAIPFECGLGYVCVKGCATIHIGVHLNIDPHERTSFIIEPPQSGTIREIASWLVRERKALSQTKKSTR